MSRSYSNTTHFTSVTLLPGDDLTINLELKVPNRGERPVTYSSVYWKLTEAPTIIQSKPVGRLRKVWRWLCA